MFMIPCQPGCLQTIPGACVKYTGPTILSPRIFQNTDLDTAVQILAAASTEGGGGTTSCVTPVTYAELSKLSDEGALQAGCWYRLTDFQTIHNIINITVSVRNYDKTDTGIQQIGPVEELILQATSPGSTVFHGYAANGDEIRYDLYPGSEVLPGSEKGAILRRKDLRLNIDLPLDWRQVKWQINGIPYFTFNGTNGSPENYTANSKDIFIAGGPAYNQYPVIIFTTPSPILNGIRISDCTAFVVNHANGVNVVSSNVMLPNASIENLQSGLISKTHPTDSTAYGYIYSPAFNLPNDL